MSDEQNILTRETSCCGVTVTVYSADSWRWFSDRREAERAHRRHLEFVESMKKSLAKSATFAIRASRPRAPNKLQRAAAEKRRKVADLKAQGFDHGEIAQRMWPEEFQKMSLVAEGTGKLLRRVYHCLRTAGEQAQVQQEQL